MNIYLCVPVSVCVCVCVLTFTLKLSGRSWTQRTLQCQTFTCARSSGIDETRDSAEGITERQKTVPKLWTNEKS